MNVASVLSDSLQGESRTEGGGSRACDGDGEAGGKQRGEQPRAEKSEALGREESGGGEGDALATELVGDEGDEFGDDLDLVAGEGPGEGEEPAGPEQWGVGGAEDEGDTGSGGERAEEPGSGGGGEQPGLGEGAEKDPGGPGGEQHSHGGGSGVELGGVGRREALGYDDEPEEPGEGQQPPELVVAEHGTGTAQPPGMW